MAKPFGKLPKDWLKATETKDYLQALAVRRKILTADLVEVRQGGTPEEQGTWCNFFSVSIIEKGCPVVVDTLGEKAGKNEFPAFFEEKACGEEKLLYLCKWMKRLGNRSFDHAERRRSSSPFGVYLYMI